MNGDLFSVLVAEDDPGIGELLQLILEVEGYIVKRAYTGDQVITALRSAPVDLLLLDVKLPDIDGLELCRYVRQQELQTKAHLPIVILSATTGDGPEAIGLAAGADDYIGKPFDLANLLERLTAQLEPLVLDQSLR